MTDDLLSQDYTHDTSDTVRQMVGGLVKLWRL